MDIEEIEQSLLGTCQELSSVVSDGEEDECLEQIAARGNIELCVCCGWWCELSEMSDGGGEYVCNDCLD